MKHTHEILKADGKYKLVKNLKSGKVYLTTEPLPVDSGKFHIDFAFAGSPGYPNEEAALAMWEKRFDGAKTERTDVRLSPIAKKQLEDLMERWGESKSDAIRRAIAIAHEKSK